MQLCENGVDSSHHVSKALALCCKDARQPLSPRAFQSLLAALFFQIDYILSL